MGKERLSKTERYLKTTEGKLVDQLTDTYLDKALALGVLTESPRDEVKKMVARLVLLQEISLDFFSIRNGAIRQYVLIAIADSLLTQRISNKEACELTKLICSNEHIARATTISASRRIIRLAELGYRFAYEYASGESETETTYDKCWKEKRIFAEDPANRDEKATKRLIEIMDIANPNSPLNRIRGVLGITAENEEPFQVVVLKHNQDYMMKRFQGTIAYFVDGRLCLPRDYDWHLLEHEYIHSQQMGFNIGASRMLGRALMEAWTEKQTKEPTYYEEQRTFLERMLRQIPELGHELELIQNDTSLNRLDRIWSRVLQTYGYRGLLLALRLSPSYASNLEGDDGDFYHGNLTLLNPELAYGGLKANLANSADWEKFFDLNAFPETEAKIWRHIYRSGDDSQKYDAKMRFEYAEAWVDVKRLQTTASLREASMLVGKLIERWIDNPQMNVDYLGVLFTAIGVKFPTKYSHFGRLIWGRFMNCLGTIGHDELKMLIDETYKQYARFLSDRQVATFMRNLHYGFLIEGLNKRGWDKEMVQHILGKLSWYADFNLDNKDFMATYSMTVTKLARFQDEDLYTDEQIMNAWNLVDDLLKDKVLAVLNSAQRRESYLLAARYIAALDKVTGMSENVGAFLGFSMKELKDRRTSLGKELGYL